ncbi:MAG: exo-alpha-sialidase [Akkermansiaceae bacterium]|nr:exo-alpha-sialidase [Akkermansiaceae bacterium]MCP5545400.1 exo-alpha-sialidase [Akkermansiaceae bacterium]MCP5548903.1 exo-alpha-sialidase [Akkermansiaceae bacterium]
MRALFLSISLCLGATAAEIEWKPETRVLVVRGGNYARIARVDGGRLLCAYSRRGVLCVKDSADEGRTWSAERRVGGWRHGAVANAELLVRKNGGVFCFFNRRPAGGNAADARYAIGFHRSDDNGRSWTEPEVIYQAGSDSNTGCWEPAGLELPDGELQVYFANELPYPDSDEQEISMLRSRDGGKTWSGKVTVAFRKGSRDGMPVPLLVPRSKGIVVAIEDNGLRGTFKPVIVASSWARGGWSDGPVGGDSPRRWPALEDPLPTRAYAGAPYLCRLGDDVTVLSFQLADNGRMEDSRMVVCLGNGRARDFGKTTHPFPEGERQLWNSLFTKDGSTVTAVSEATIDGVRGIWTVDGKLR